MIAWPGLIALVAGLVMASSLRVALRFPAARGHNVALDGLRGYLAFAVFLHHAVVWHFYLRDGNWGRPPLRVYAELGLTAVNFFFMITGLLFVGKILDSRRRPIDWLQLYISRALRILPLYAVAMLALFVLVGQGSGWRLREPLPQLFMHMGGWLSFGMTGGFPLVNAYAQTGILIAFVVWTLVYEWLFYFSLPLIALMLGRPVPWWLAMMSVAAVLLVALHIPNLFFPTAFVGGGLVAALARHPRINALCNTSHAAVVALAAMAALVAGIAPHVVNMLLIFVAFLVVACGNGLFGLLSNRAAVELGEASYSIYLLHSLVLSGVLMFGLTPLSGRALPQAAYWALVTGIGCLVVLLSTLTYRYIEKPTILASPRVVDWARRRWHPARAPARSA